MLTPDTLFAGSMPEIYDRLLVPLIFEPYARDLAGRVARARPRNLLETAAGTGVLTRALASFVPDACMIATDLNQPMLAQAIRRQPHGRRIDWKQADAVDLPFEDESFDVVACQFGVMFFSDRVKAYREARRVLRSGGRFFFNVWDRISENEFADVVTQALAEVFPHDPPRFLARTPHGYHEVERIRDELNDAGFSDVSVHAVTDRSTCSSPREPAVAYCQGTPLRSEIEVRDQSRLEDATNHSAAALSRRFGTGAIEGKTAALVLTASR